MSSAFDQLAARDHVGVRKMPRSKPDASRDGPLATRLTWSGSRSSETGHLSS